MRCLCSRSLFDVLRRTPPDLDQAHTELAGSLCIYNTHTHTVESLVSKQSCQFERGGTWYKKEKNIKIREPHQPLDNV